MAANFDKSAFSPRNSQQQAALNTNTGTGQQKRGQQSGMGAGNGRGSQRQRHLKIGAQSSQGNYGGMLPTKIDAKTIAVAGVSLLVGGVLGAGGFFFYDQYNPTDGLLNNRVVGQVKGVADVGEDFSADFVERISDVETLRAENAIQQEIYKDVQNGDWAIVSGENLIIYRNSSKEVIYQGPTADAQAEINRSNLIETINNKAVNAEIISARDSNTTIRVITNPENLQSEDSEFYGEAKAGDIIVFFESENIIVLYDPNTQEIYNSGKLSTQIG